MKGLMISCKKAGELIEKKNAEKLSFFELMQLRLHTTMCEVCRIYEKQSAMIHRMLEKGLKENNPFNDEEVKRVKEKILKEKIS